MFRHIALVVVVGLLTLNKTSEGLRISDVMSSLVPRLDRIKPKNGNEPMKIKCAESLPPPLAGQRYSWYNQDAMNINHLIEEGDPVNNEIWIKHPDGKPYEYLYCVDPRTGNVVKGFNSYNGSSGHAEQSKFPVTRCGLHADYLTVLNCRDMFVPPVSTARCRWRYITTTGKTVHSVEGQKDVMILQEDSTFKPREGNYTCSCDPDREKQSIMTFIVKQSTDGAIDLGNFQFCIHVNKTPADCSTLIQGPLSNVDNTADPNLMSKIRHLTAANHLLVAAVVVLLVVSLSLVLVLVLRRRSTIPLEQSPEG